jgi:hypothetical protein
LIKTKEKRDLAKLNISNILKTKYGNEEVFVHDWFSDYYLISNLGRVKSLRSGKILKPTKNNHGYYCVKLYEDDGVHTVTIHRLVGRSFLFCGDLEINHINANKKDNTLNNLEIVTRQENIQHAKENGLYKKPKGKDNSNFKFTDEIVNDMVELQSLGYKLKDIAESFGTSISYTCTLIALKKRNKR